MKEKKMNIAQELFDAWQLCRKSSDSSVMMQEFGISRPTINNALNLGHVIMPGLVEKITDFFERRSVAEKEQATKLLNRLKK